MASNEAPKKSGNFVLTTEALIEALPKFHLSTQAVHADDFSLRDRSQDIEDMKADFTQAFEAVLAEDS
ncbi:hypothetical protein BHE90_005754 [Fusarium euwallaceae]|uniref:Uncharacterized protein n=1 Tax=Fusarium euwallaceae TaxID=1147111 RepID=A0A430LVH8_9HYPO|nr:hypothetical protein BHE90_005754 [Fusarium euwallaceae]